MIIQLLFFSVVDFAIYTLAALVFFSTSLLFFDSWQINKKKKTPLLRGIGFLLLSLTYAFYASSIQNPSTNDLVQVIKVASFALILASVYKEPILKKPQLRSAAFLLIPTTALYFSYELIISSIGTVLCLLISLIYLKRSTKGLDKQLLPVAVAFIFFTIAESIKITLLWSNTTSVYWSKILATHSIVWNISIMLTLIGVVVLAKWVWGYIRFRLNIQLFVTILTATFSVFLLVTSFFTYLLINNLEKDALTHLETDVKVLQYSLERLQLESLAHTRSIAADNTLQSAIISKDTKKLYQLSANSLISQNLTSLIIASNSGEVLMRAENEDSLGDNLINDPLIQSALKDQQLSTLLITYDNPISPTVFVRSATPIKTSSEKILGVAMSGFGIDDAFVDGIKAATNLDTTIFAGNKRAATTIVSPDGKSKFIGTSESDKKITQLVLEEGNNYLGKTTILNEPYYAAYTPLRAYGGEIIGMLFIGKPQIQLLELAQRSINLTFLGSVILMIGSVLPSYLISKYIQENLEA